MEDPEEVYVNEIHIYETYHAGAVIRVSLKDKEKGVWQTAWESPTGKIKRIYLTLSKKYREITVGLKTKIVRPRNPSNESHFFARAF